MKASLIVLALGGASAQNSICTSETNTFTAKVNLIEMEGFPAGEFGYFYFEECGNVSNPTIGLEVGQVYTFNQSDISNYFHPLGFAYYPDGAHVDKNELEPTISEGGCSGDVCTASENACVDMASCPAPMYFIGDSYLGKYSNIPEVINVTTGKSDFGLDAYEPLFFRPITEWAGYKPFSVKLKFDDSTYGKDLFYFCHIHHSMSGRIKLLKDGEPINADDTPELGYDYNAGGSFDQKCGTYGLDDYQLPHAECPKTFVCGAEDQSDDIQHISECLNAMNCAMLAGMTTGTKASSEMALFIHSMIPHHQNAVNMAKALLKMDVTPCDDLTSDTPGCVMQGMLREIINGQNAEIQAMKAVLKSQAYPEFDDCVVNVEGTSRFLKRL